MKHRSVLKGKKVGEEEEEEDEETPNKCFITGAADKKEAQWLICESGGQGHRGGAGHNVTLMYASKLSAWCPVFITSTFRCMGLKLNDAAKLTENE